MTIFDSDGITPTNNNENTASTSVYIYRMYGHPVFIPFTSNVDTIMQAYKPAAITSHIDTMDVSWAYHVAILPRIGYYAANLITSLSHDDDITSKDQETLRITAGEIHKTIYSLAKASCDKDNATLIPTIQSMLISTFFHINTLEKHYSHESLADIITSLSDTDLHLTHSSSEKLPETRTRHRHIIAHNYPIIKAKVHKILQKYRENHSHYPSKDMIASIVTTVVSQIPHSNMEVYKTLIPSCDKTIDALTLEQRLSQLAYISTLWMDVFCGATAWKAYEQLIIALNIVRSTLFDRHNIAYDNWYTQSVKAALMDVQNQNYSLCSSLTVNDSPIHQEKLTSFFDHYAKPRYAY